MNTEMQTRRASSPMAFRPSIRAAGDKGGGLGMAVGHAAVWYRPNDPGTQYELARGVVERVARGAFTDHLKSSRDVVALLNHSNDYLLGRRSAGTLSLEEDDVGLHYEIELPDTTVGRDVSVLLGRRDLIDASFAFYVEDETITEEGNLIVVTLTKLRLVDVSPVVTGAYASATSGPADLTDWERQAADRLRTLERHEADLAASLARQKARADGERRRRELDLKAMDT